MTLSTFLEAGLAAMLRREETRGQFSFLSLCVCSLVVHANYIVKTAGNYHSDGLRNCPFLVSNKHIDGKIENEKDFHFQSHKISPKFSIKLLINT